MIARILLAIMAALACSGVARAGEPAPFTADSLERIEARYAGRPFILSLWSVNECSYCIAELTLFGKFARTHRGLPLVLVAADSPAYVPAMRQTLERLGLAGVDAWVFDDPIPERLRHAIDPAWYGELPRTYLYDARHRRQAVVGELGERRLRAWLREQRLDH
ncbi:thioredoxin domain-containing protein [Thiobacillus sedimenti]|uniref:TlpA family protein disulfide reductase n=1 Tax=Thiobacillus sedimenti TaxID=3110231 RepID=A0ABZ1CLC3_9PROT|nr:TlpA family protein disulfide reductase [Thiobacillus sp. SCUT-2]WRS40186.1 TlpA family protein disulfide reductase [Thiobacillus sp. SCUT-2]